MSWKPVAYAIGAITLLAVVGTSGHVPGAPAAGSSPTDCQATTIATEGEPPATTPQFSPQQLCNALEQAEEDAACMGDWTPPDRIEARQFCIELHRRGCGNPQRDCDRIPADQVYYHHR
jgi:hypothetical protein